MIFARFTHNRQCFTPALMHQGWIRSYTPSKMRANVFEHDTQKPSAVSRASAGHKNATWKNCQFRFIFIFFHIILLNFRKATKTTARLNWKALALEKCYKNVPIANPTERYIFFLFLLYRCLSLIEVFCYSLSFYPVIFIYCIIA